MKKQHTFKNYEIEGIEGTFTIQVKVISEWELQINFDGKKYQYSLEKQTFGITKEEALNFIDLFNRCELDEFEI